MNGKTRKHSWPVSLAVMFAVVGMLAAIVALTALPGLTSAQGTPPPPPPPPSGGTPTPGGTPPPPPAPPAAPVAPVEDAIENSSTSASAGIELQLTIGSLPMAAVAGSSIELYLEDDFQVPDDIARDTVYFRVSNRSDANVNGGGRVYSADPVEIDDGDHYGGDDDWSIRVFIPDMNDAEDSGFNGPAMGDTLVLVFTEAAGIKNHSEAGTHSVGYSALGPDDEANDGPQVELGTVATLAKITLSDEDNDRGYELTVTGSGFNNGTSAAVSVLHDASANPDDKTTWPSCAEVLTNGTRAGIATVGSDDKVAVSFQVTVPTFQAGKNNYICMVDGEGRSSSTDVEQFELQPSIRIVPNSAAAGDTVTVFAQDYPRNSGGLQELKIAGQVVYPSSAARPGNAVNVSSTSIGNDGSATATFDLPGSLSGSALEGTLRIDAMWADDGEDTKLTITGSQLMLSKAEALPNELITITGDGFGGDVISAADITIDGVALLIDEDSLNSDDEVEVSSAGQFVASVILWPADDDGSNPTLIAGTHTIDVEDDAGFSGSAVVVIAEPTIKVTPGVASPRDVIAISGENWPADNLDGAGPVAVTINVDDGVRERNYSVFADSSGRFRQEHRIASNVAIPSTNQVKVSLDTDIVKVASFEVPSAILTVEPGMGQPGDTITLSVDGMPVYDNVDEVKIAGRSVLPSGNFSTDATGSVTVDNVLIPGIDPGVYSVQLEVGETIAIGSLEVLSEGPIGTDTPVADAVEALGDSLVAVFYFDDVGKVWSFYDPRPEFADLNTLSDMVGGEAYWILVSETVEDVVLNDKARNLTCRGDDCWNLEVW